MKLVYMGKDVTGVSKAQLDNAILNSVGYPATPVYTGGRWKGSNKVYKSTMVKQMPEVITDTMTYFDISYNDFVTEEQKGKNVIIVNMEVMVDMGNVWVKAPYYPGNMRMDYSWSPPLKKITFYSNYDAFSRKTLYITIDYVIEGEV